MIRLTIALLLLVVFTVQGCSQENVQLEGTDSTPATSVQITELTAVDILNNLADQTYILSSKEQLGEVEPILNFGKNFVNLYSGAVAEEHTVSFENYISNPNLLMFTNKMLELEQQKKDNIGVIFGHDNVFLEPEIEQLGEDLYFLNIPFSNQGSTRSVQMLVQSADRSLKIVDFYFGNKDGVDTLATGHPADRKIDNPNLWDDQEWVDGVFEKLEHLSKDS